MESAWLFPLPFENFFQPAFKMNSVNMVASPIKAYGTVDQDTMSNTIKRRKWTWIGQTLLKNNNKSKESKIAHVRWLAYSSMATVNIYRRDIFMAVFKRNPVPV